MKAHGRLRTLTCISTWETTSLTICGCLEDNKSARLWRSVKLWKKHNLLKTKSDCSSSAHLHAVYCHHTLYYHGMHAASLFLHSHSCSLASLLPNETGLRTGQCMQISVHWTGTWGLGEPSSWAFRSGLWASGRQVPLKGVWKPCSHIIADFMSKLL
jgi:hypothetical protein